MDPLSITTAVISLVDIARRIKDSIDKVGRTRHKLQQLAEGIVEELLELQKLCQDGQGHLNDLDPESTRSLKKLHSELMNVLERCLKLAEQSRKSNHGLPSIKHYIVAWIRNAGIEAHILRLRDRASSVHRRFTMIASLRAGRVDNELLIATSELRVTMNRIESLLSPLFITSHTLGTYPASVLDHASPSGIEYQYLHLQVQKTVALLGSILATHTFTTEETRDAVASRSQLGGRSVPQRATLMRSTTIEILEMLQVLEREPSYLALSEGARNIRNIGSNLNDLELNEDAAAIFIGATNVYQTLMKTDPSTYLPYVVWGLRRLSLIHFGTPEGLKAAKRAVEICRGVTAMLQEGSSLHLAHSLTLYSLHLTIDNHFDEAVKSAQESLMLQGRAPTLQRDPDGPSITWEASGEKRVAPSSGPVFRPHATAINDVVCLKTYAYILACVGRFNISTSIAASQIVNSLTFLSKSLPQAGELGIRNVDDPDYGDVSGEGGSGVRSAVLEPRADPATQCPPVQMSEG